MLLTCSLIASAALCYLLFWYATRTYDYWSKRNVKGPKPVPLFGNLWDSALRRKNFAVVHKEIYDQFPGERVIGMYRMTTPCQLLRDLNIIKCVLIKDFDYFSDRGVSFSDKGISNNLFHAPTDKWRVLRNRFSPVFTSGKLKNMIYLMDQCGELFVNHIQQLCLTQCEHEVHSLMQKYTTATIATCAFGLDIDTMSDKMPVLKKIDSIIFSPTFIDELDMMYPGVLKKFKIEPFPQEIPDFFEQLVSTVVKQRSGLSTNRNDFMDLILELRQQGVIRGPKRDENAKEKTLELTNDIIAAQTFVFYAAGYETSANTMSFMLYEMAKNPDVQDKLIAEVDEVLKKYERKLSFDALNEFTYMEKVFNETLRLYPIVDPIQRQAQQDYQIPDTDIVVKKGQLVIISAHAIQRDPKLYPNPDKFDPERFSTGNLKNMHSCAYLPFGNGPRNCIGLRFAKLQSRVCMVKFFSKFRVEPSSRTMPKMMFGPRRFILASKGGKYLNIIPREK